MERKSLIKMKNIGFLIFFLHFIAIAYSQNQNYKNLVFEGAGIRGIAYCGTLKILEEQNILEDIEKVGGTSAGAITALMVSLGYSSSEIAEIISDTNFKKFNDGKFVFIGGITRVNKKYGWYRGDKFLKWLERIIRDKTGDSEITFEQLKEHGFKKLYVTATSLNRQKLLVFSAETYPQMKVKNAVRVSMSVPIYFKSVFIDSLGTVYDRQNEALGTDVVVDGGIIGNYPIFIFDEMVKDTSNVAVRIPNSKTLGVRIDSDNQIKNDSGTRELVPISIRNFNDYLGAFYIFIIENLNRNILIPEDWDRTISVSSVGIGPRIKKLTDEDKSKLIKSGEEGALNFFQK